MGGVAFLDVYETSHMYPINVRKTHRLNPTDCADALTYSNLLLSLHTSKRSYWKPFVRQRRNVDLFKKKRSFTDSNADNNFRSLQYILIYFKLFAFRGDFPKDYVSQALSVIKSTTLKLFVLVFRAGLSSFVTYPFFPHPVLRSF